MGRYNKFWLSLAGPVATGLTLFAGVDAGAAEALVASAASLIGSLAVAAGPANR